ncbi:MAG: hypothetical protein Q3992_02995 [Bacteroides sp.]|nr:hypothetical protein [Bacteroides sp.]
MKRLLLFTLMAFAYSYFALSQEVVYDKTIDSVRVVTTTEEYLLGGGLYPKLYMTCSELTTKADTSYCINIRASYSKPICFPTNSRFLIRLKSGRVISLTSKEMPLENHITQGGYPASAVVKTHLGMNQCNDSTCGNRLYVIFASYPISKKDFFEVMDGVSKVRIEMTPEYMEKKYRRNSMGKDLRKLYSAISGYKNKPPFEEGF